MVMVIKRNGSHEPFMPAKIVLSMIRTGVPAGYAQTIAQNIERTARDGITTGEIRIKALCMLRARDPDWMKRSIVPNAQYGKNGMSYRM
jgi:transcriptional repressor NrdR